MNYDAIMRKALRDMENSLYNGMIKDVFFSDNPTKADEAALEFFYALNRRGVSSKNIFEALKEAGKKVKPDA